MSNRGERRERKEGRGKLFLSLRSLRSLRLNDCEEASAQARVGNHPFLIR